MDQSYHSISSDSTRPETPRGTPGSSVFGSPLHSTVTNNSSLDLSDEDFLKEFESDIEDTYGGLFAPSGPDVLSAFKDTRLERDSSLACLGGESQDGDDWPLPKEVQKDTRNSQSQTSKTPLDRFRELASRVSMSGLRRRARKTQGQSSNSGSKSKNDGDDMVISDPTTGMQHPDFEELLRVLSLPETKGGQAALHARRESKKTVPRLIAIGSSAVLSSNAGEELLDGGRDGDEAESRFVIHGGDLLTGVSTEGGREPSALSAIPSTPWTIGGHASGVSPSGSLTPRWIPGNQGGPQAPRSEGDQSDATTIRPPGSAGEEPARPDGLFPHDDGIELITSGMGGGRGAAM